MRTKVQVPLRWVLTGLLLILLFQSCKKDDELGLDLINTPGDMMGFGFTDTATLVAWSMTEDSLQTSGVYLNLLGSYFDPVFGKVTSGIYTQALLSNSNVSFGTNPVGDSLVLTLQFNGYYGDSMASHRLRVYEIDPSATFHKDSVYYSHQELPLGDLVFDDVVWFNPVDSLISGGDTLPPMLRIALGPNLVQKFINASGTSDLASNDAFRNFFKGLHLKVDEAGSINEGSIGYFNMNADLSKMVLYYHNDADTLSYNFVINDECAKFSHFDHAQYQHAEPGLKSQDTNGVNSRLYLQAMAGQKIRVRMPHIADFYKNGPVAISRAELVIKADPSDFTATDFKPAAKLTVARITEEGKYAFISDILEGETFLGGSYDETRNEYRIRITRYLHDILSGKYENLGFDILLSAAAIRADRVAVLGNTPAEKNLRIEVVYVKP